MTVVNQGIDVWFTPRITVVLRRSSGRATRLVHPSLLNLEVVEEPAKCLTSGVAG